MLFPVSIKGVSVRDGRVVLLRNERDEWELPGGKLDRDEEPEACLRREIEEEVGWKVRVGPILDSWVYRVDRDRTVFVVAYGCHVLTGGPPILSQEHRGVRLFTEAEVPALKMPEGYRRSISLWYRRLRGR